jgi:hypothetical protein
VIGVLEAAVSEEPRAGADHKLSGKEASRTMGHSGLAIRVVAVTGNAIRRTFEDANGLP